MERKMGKFLEAEVAESFTFSSLDLNFSTELFSDEESDFDDHENEETYIEIALEPALLHTIPPALSLGDLEEEGEAEKNINISTAAGNDQELEFSTSFSSQVSFPGFSSSSPTLSSNSNTFTTITTATATTTTSNSSECSATAGAGAYGGYTIKSPAESLVVPLPASGSNFSRIHKNIINGDHNKRNLQFTLTKLRGHRLLKAFLSALNLKASSSSSSAVIITEEYARPDDPHNPDQMTDETLRSCVRPIKSSRKTSKNVTSGVISNGGVVMKLLVKFQSTSVRILSTLRGSWKLEYCSRMNIAHKRKQTKYFQSSTINSSTNPFSPPPPSSTKRIYARENSIQAAIAHCKK